MSCHAEMCDYWAGDGCVCSVMDLQPAFENARWVDPHFGYDDEEDDDE